MSRNPIPICFAVAAAFACSETAVAPVAQTDGPTPLASQGHGPVIHRVTIGGPDVCTGFGAKPGCDANFSLIALQYADGSVSGQWIDRFSQNFGGGGITVAVNCLAVSPSGTTAWIGGVVTKPDGLAGMPSITRARDLGTSANDPPDRFVPLYGPDGISTDCLDGPFFGILEVAEGQVTIQ